MVLRTASTLPRVFDSFPLSASTAWWCTAWLRGHAGLTDVTDHATRVTPVHSTVAASPGPWAPESTGLGQFLLEVKDAGAVAAACALPVPGDLHGLAGPAELNRSATEHGEALLLLGARPGQVVAAAVPVTVGAGTTWLVHRAAPRPPSDLGQADRELRLELTESATRLAQLDVASWSPDTVDGLLNLDRGPVVPAPVGTPERAVALARRSVLLLDIVELAEADGTGGAVSATEAFARQEALDVLARAARHALVAACSADAWPL